MKAFSRARSQSVLCKLDIFVTDLPAPKCRSLGVQATLNTLTPNTKSQTRASTGKPCLLGKAAALIPWCECTSVHLPDTSSSSLLSFWRRGVTAASNTESDSYTWLTVSTVLVLRAGTKFQGKSFWSSRPLGDTCMHHSLSKGRFSASCFPSHD